MGYGVQVCVKCSADVSAAKRFKDREGRLYCAGCAAAMKNGTARRPPAAGPGAVEDDGTFKLEDEPAAQAPVTRHGSGNLDTCPDCGCPLPAGRDVCAACGFNRRTGFSIGHGSAAAGGGAADGTERRPHTPKPCKKCGYDLTGLKTGRCPECGTFNVRMARGRGPQESERQTLRKMYVQPLIMAGVGVAVCCIGYGILGLAAAGAGSGPASILAFLVFYAVSVPAGFIAYVLCSMAFIGFDEPLGVTFVRLAAVYAVTDAVGAVMGPLPIINWGTWPVQAIVYLGLLMQVMELDFEDAWAVAGVSFVAHVAAFIAFAYLWSTIF